MPATRKRLVVKPRKQIRVTHKRKQRKTIKKSQTGGNWFLPDKKKKILKSLLKKRTITPKQYETILRKINKMPSSTDKASQIRTFVEDCKNVIFDNLQKAWNLVSSAEKNTTEMSTYARIIESNKSSSSQMISSFDSTSSGYRSSSSDTGKINWFNSLRSMEKLVQKKKINVGYCFQMIYLLNKRWINNTAIQAEPKKQTFKLLYKEWIKKPKPYLKDGEWWKTAVAA